MILFKQRSWGRLKFEHDRVELINQLKSTLPEYFTKHESMFEDLLILAKLQQMIYTLKNTYNVPKEDLIDLVKEYTDNLNKG